MGHGVARTKGGGVHPVRVKWNFRIWDLDLVPSVNAPCDLGAFSHNMGTAPIVMLLIPETPLTTNHLQKHA